MTNISQHGFWLLVSQEELFLSFDQVPWFREATVAAIQCVEQPAAGHLRWPDLDVDLALDSIRHPERYPLTAR
ncbi:MAG: DUF2442 domain-containing protein [Pseudomonadota bacterium]